VADKKGEGKFLTNMALGGAVGASTGNAVGTIMARPKVRYRPVRSAAGGAAFGGAAGLGLIAANRHRGKVKKNDSVSAFGVDHGRHT
jgi:hypothetical protein